MIPTAQGPRLLKPILLFLICWLATSLAISQTIGGVEEIENRQVLAWYVSSPTAYQGVYQLGYSEGEYSLLILVTDDQCIAQIKSGGFNDAATEWITTYETLQEARIEGDRFYSREFNGQFSIYDDGYTRQQGIKRLQSENLDRDYEFGRRADQLEDYFMGRYPQASIRLMNRAELEAYSPVELQLMRNEIFARYGYQFRAGGKMDTYFRTEDWYEAQHADVTAWLTEIEKANIALIRKVEQGN